MSAIGWAAIENALNRWAVAGSGLAAAAVIWSYPKGGGPRPTPPYLALSFASVRSVGHDWTDREIVAEPEEGREIRLVHRGPRVATLSLQLFADEATGETGAMSRLHDTLAALDVHVDTLDAAGIGIGDIGPVQLVAGRVNTLLEPRAVAEVELHLESELERYATYIERIEASLELEPLDEIAVELVIDPPPEPPEEP